MTYKHKLDVYTQCQNLICPNKAGEGAMVLVIVEGEHPGQRPLILILCAVCAHHYEAD